MTNHAANIFRARMLAAARWGINGQTEAGSQPDANGRGLRAALPPPLALTAAGVVLTRHRAAPRPVGLAPTVVGALGLLLVTAVKVWFLSTFDPSQPQPNLTHPWG